MYLLFMSFRYEKFFFCTNFHFSFDSLSFCHWSSLYSVWPLRPDFTLPTAIIDGNSIVCNVLNVFSVDIIFTLVEWLLFASYCFRCHCCSIFYEMNQKRKIKKDAISFIITIIVCCYCISKFSISSFECSIHVVFAFVGFAISRHQKKRTHNESIDK